MSRRSTPQKKLDQLRFPVFVRVMVPPDGFGNAIDEIHEWLRLRTGHNKNYAIHSDNQPTVEAIGIYVNDIQIVTELVEKFDLKVAVRQQE